MTTENTDVRAFTATVVVVGPEDRLAEAGAALESLGNIGVKAILISEGDESSPEARVAADVVEISGLAPRYLNNAVASLRLSSLPALVWWRGGSIEALDDLAAVADRLVLDVESPEEEWRLAPRYFEHTAITDLRWTRLTRWRLALAHMFDLPQVARSKFRRLSVEASDPHAARLFAGWLRARLGWSGVEIDIEKNWDEGGSPLSRVKLDAERLSISLELIPGRECLVASLNSADAFTRVVPLADGSLASLISEELGVRSRDLAFEQALTASQEMAG